jgi:hypothetical protein
MADITAVHGPMDFGEPDRASITANGIVIDVIANDDGSVYVECYAFEGSKFQAVVQHAAINRYMNRHPNFRLDLAGRDATMDGLSHV